MSKNLRNSNLLKASWMIQEFCNFGEVRTRDEEDINELFCRMLDAAHKNYELVNKEGNEYFVVK